MPYSSRAARGILGTILVLAAGCGGGSQDEGAGTDAFVDAGLDGTSERGTDGTVDGGDSGTHPAPPTCEKLSTLPKRTPTYFVDFDSGSDTADGKTQGTAWKHSPGDASATGVPLSAKLAAGDVVQFKGGVVYKGQIAITASGSASAPLVLEGGPQVGWGSGKAIIDGETTRSLGIALNGASYVVVEGFEIRNFAKDKSSVGVSVDGGDHDQVVGCQLHDIYYAKNPGGTSWEAQRGTGISVNNSPNTNVYANVVRDVGNAGITFTANGRDVVGGQIACNEVTNMNWGIALALGDSKPGTHLAGLTVSHNYIHDFDQYYVSGAWHRDGIFAFSRPDTDTLSIEDIEIASNYFEDNTSATGSTAWIYIEYVCRNFNIHHNVLNASRSYYAIRVLGDGFQVEGNHVFANNVIANANGIGTGMHVMQSSGAQIINNIFYDDDYGYIIATDSMKGFFADYNVLYRVDGAAKIATLNAGPAEKPAGTTMTLAELQASGLEKHGIFGDPAFGAAFKTIDADASGFKPKPTSPAKDKGTLLEYTEDFAGTPIPQGAGPDIGAFEQ
jgi:hypothetical protein